MSLFQNPLQAKDNLLLYGTELSPESSYYYLGTIIPINYQEDNYYLRLWTDFLTYEYDSSYFEEVAPSEFEEVDFTVEAKSKNIQLSLGRQFLHDSGWFNVYLGYASNDTTLKPDDLSNDSRGKHNQFIISADGDYKLTGCEHNLSYGVSYALDQKGYWFRVRPICWTYQKKKVGFELVSHGDSNYRHVQLGAVLFNELLSSATDYSIKTGLTATQDSDVFPYIGIEFTTRY